MTCLVYIAMFISFYAYLECMGRIINNCCDKLVTQLYRCKYFGNKTKLLNQYPLDGKFRKSLVQERFNILLFYMF